MHVIVVVFAVVDDVIVVVVVAFVVVRIARVVLELLVAVTPLLTIVVATPVCAIPPLAFCCDRSADILRGEHMQQCLGVRGQARPSQPTATGNLPRCLLSLPLGHTLASSSLNGPLCPATSRISAFGREAVPRTQGLRRHLPRCNPGHARAGATTPAPNKLGGSSDDAHKPDTRCAIFNNITTTAKRCLNVGPGDPRA